MESGLLCIISQRVKLPATLTEFGGEAAEIVSVQLTL